MLTLSLRSCWWLPCCCCHIFFAIFFSCFLHAIRCRWCCRFSRCRRCFFRRLFYASLRFSSFIFAFRHYADAAFCCPLFFRLLIRRYAASVDIFPLIAFFFSFRFRCRCFILRFSLSLSAMLSFFRCSRAAAFHWLCYYWYDIAMLPRYFSLFSMFRHYWCAAFCHAVDMLPLFSCHLMPPCCWYAAPPLILIFCCWCHYLRHFRHCHAMPLDADIITILIFFAFLFIFSFDTLLFSFAYFRHVFITLIRCHAVIFAITLMLLFAAIIAMPPLMFTPHFRRHFIDSWLRHTPGHFRFRHDYFTPWYFDILSSLPPPLDADAAAARFSDFLLLSLRYFDVYISLSLMLSFHYASLIIAFASLLRCWFHFLLMLIAFSPLPLLPMLIAIDAFATRWYAAAAMMPLLLRLAITPCRYFSPPRFSPMLSLMLLTLYY